MNYEEVPFMKDLYTDKDLLAISGQLKKRYLLLGCGLAVILAVIVWSMVIRTEWLTVVSVFLFFAIAVFVIEMFCLPLHRYKKLITAALTGLSAFVMLVFCLLYTPCVAAIASVKRELGQRWAWRVVLLQCSVAWITAMLVRLIGIALGAA